MTESIDTRNTKYKAKVNHQSTAASSKSYNHKNYMKYMKRRQEKMDRDEARAVERKMMQQMAVNNQTWKAVDDTDAKHMQKEAE